MKTFYQFIHEDFNSSSSVQFPLVVTMLGKRTQIPIFFESIQQKPFNLPRYLETFESQVAHETLKSSGDYRGIVFCVPPKYLIFMYTGKIVHPAVCKALDSNTKLNKYPSNNYFKIYSDTNTSAFKDTWCFPFVYTSNGDIISNLSDNAIKKLFDEKKLESEFKLDTRHSVVRALRTLNKV